MRLPSQIVLFLLLLPLAVSGCEWRGPFGKPSAKSAPIMVLPKGPSPLELGMSQIFLTRAARFLDAEAYGAAVESYSDALAADPSNANIYFLRASAQLKRQRINEAIADLSAAIESSAQSTYYLSRCGAYFVTGQWDAAISDCTDTIRLAPMESDAYFLRALTYLTKGELESALADTLVVLMIRPGEPNAKHLLEDILAQKERREHEQNGVPVLKTDIEPGR